MNMETIFQKKEDTPQAEKETFHGLCIAQIKHNVGIDDLLLNRVLDGNDEWTGWYKHWENDRRIAITITKQAFLFAKEHKGSVPEEDDTPEIIKERKLASKLSVSQMEKEGDQGTYTLISVYLPAEETL